MKIQYKIKALRLLLSLLSKKQWPIELKDVPIQLQFDYSIQQVISNNKEPLLIFHSINGMGNKDPRVQQLAAIATRVGFDVYLPHLSDTANCLLKPDSVDRMCYFLKTFFQHIKTPFSVLAPSFEASLCLEALSHPDIKPMIKSMCSIGASHDPNEMLSDALNKEPRELYNLLVVIKTMLFESGQLTPNLSKIVESKFAIEREVTYDIDIETLTLSTKEQFWKDNLFNQQAVRDACAESGIDKYRWELAERLHLITTPIALLHGQTDNTVPVESAYVLHQKLTKAPRKLAVTNFLTHGDIQSKALLLRDIVNVINTAAFFLEHAFRKGQ